MKNGDNCDLAYTKKSKEPLIHGVIFDEFVQAKSWEQYVSDYAGHKRDWVKYFNMIIVIFALIGGSTWSTWDAIGAEWATPLTFAALGASQLLLAVKKYTVVNDADLQNFDKLRRMCVRYADKMERLLIASIEKNSNKNELEKKYFGYREMSYEINSLKDSLNIKPNKRMVRLVECRIKDYCEKRYGIEESR